MAKRVMSGWMAGSMAGAALGASLAFAGPPVPQAGGPATAAATEWHLERGTEDGLSYVAVTANNPGTDIALQLVCSVDAQAAVTLFGEVGASADLPEAAAVTTRMTGRPPRSDQWEQALEEGDVRTLDLGGRDAFDLIAALAQTSAGEVRFEVAPANPTGGAAVERYGFDLGKGAEERGVLAAACANWRSGSDL